MDPSAEEVYSGFLEAQGKGDVVDFEELCRRNPPLEDALRALHSLHCRPLTDESVDLTVFQGTDLSGFKELQRGDWIGRYRVDRLLGHGGVGVVYQAEQLVPFRKVVALKLLRAGLDSGEFLARFEVERQALALMHHPYIVGVHDAGLTENGRPFFAMEFVPGEPITAYCDCHHLSVAERLQLFLKVCDAVQHAHQKGIIHRDLKPTNVLVMVQEAADPIPKVIDFGFAKALHRPLVDHSFRTEWGQFIGTPEYMAPEQWEAGNLDIDTRVDIYSLGVLLYQLLAGDLPIDSKSLRAALDQRLFDFPRRQDPITPSKKLLAMGEASRKVASERKTDPQGLGRLLKYDLDWIVMKALEKDRTHRYATASELAADLRRYLGNEPVEARPPSVGYLFRKFGRRNRKALTAAAALLLATAGALSAQAYLQNAGRRARSRELLQTAATIRRESDSVLSRIIHLRAIHRTQVIEMPGWVPIWERKQELNTWKELSECASRYSTDVISALTSARQAAEVAPPGSHESRAAVAFQEEIDVDSLEEIRGIGDLSIGDLLKHIRYRGSQAADSLTRLEVVTDPPGAEVFCFRFEERGTRLVPRPFAVHGDRPPAKALENWEPGLIVETIWKPGLMPPFEPGDRIISIDGKEVRSEAELSEVLRSVGADQPVRAKVGRGGKDRECSWTPFPSSVLTWARERNLPLQAGRLLKAHLQFGFTLAGYPLEFGKESSPGSTAEGSAAIGDLPPGSYLLVLRKPGHIETRLPLFLDAPAAAVQHERVVLYREEEAPPGYLYVTAGASVSGGDAEAYSPLRRRTERTAGFFMARFEVTLGEWLEFLNDPEVKSRIASGELSPSSPEVARELEKTDRKTIRVIPLYQGKPLFIADSGGAWTLNAPLGMHARFPAMGVCQLAAREYARWLTAWTRAQGKAWSYRLPTDLEWERAARGADRRLHVWGNYPAWSFCWSYPGNFESLRKPGVVGISPLDESVFGIRDLAGSVCEHTADRIGEGSSFTSYRGGSWYTPDEKDFRISSRRGMLPWNARVDFGFRLVVDLPGSARR